MTLRTRFAAEITADPDVWVSGVLARVRSEIPGLVRDDDAATLAASSSRALLEQFAAALAGTSEPYAAPEPALRFARALARTDVSLSLLLRSYRLGQELLFSRAAELVDPGDLEGLRDVGLLTFRYVDAVVGEVTVAFEAEREAVLRGTALRRERMVDRLLAGEEPADAEVERVLGWRLAGRHLALVAWTGEAEHDTGVLPAAVRRLVAWAGDGPALVTRGPHGEVRAWVRPSGADLRRPPAALAAGLDGVRVAFGEVGEGRRGFVGAHRQADAARRVARYLPDRALVLHADVALLGLLLADPAAAARFVADELGDLSGGRHGDLRATARAYYERGQDTTATAGVLGVHRNTVMRRLARAETLLGRRLAQRPTETLTALLLAEVDLSGR